MRSAAPLRRALVLSFVVLSALAGFASSASAATRLFIAVANGDMKIWEVNPVTGVKIDSFVATAAPATRPGLAFNGTELFYTDENLAVVRVFDLDGNVLRNLPKPAGLEPGSGMGVSATSLFMVGLDGNVTRIDPITGAVQSSFNVPGSMHGLTYAGSRGTFFVVVNDSATIQERTPAGALVNTITVNPAAETFRGLAFSSSSNLLFGTRSGKLWAVNPNTGTIQAGYPVDLNDGVGNFPPKSGAAAADEIVSCGDSVVTPPETCDPPGSQLGNGNSCRSDCTYCGDGVTQTPELCDNGANNSDSTPGACRTDCSLPVCGDGVTDPGEGCDDGNQNDDDACRNNCTPPLCGDGELDPGEICDDGNQINTDACRNNCTQPFCGDGIKDANELCDDGNTNNNDGCNANCVPEICGDGIIQPGIGEECEPPLVNGCGPDCRIPDEICTDFVDNDGDGLVDCFDPDCDCPEIGRDPGQIRFDPRGDGDLFTVHGSLVPNTGHLDPANEVIGIQLANANGEIYFLLKPAHTLTQVGRNLARFRDRQAQRNRSGLARLDVRYYPKRNNYTFVLKTYDDLSAATIAKMSVQLVIGDDAFLNVSEWQKTPKGWILTLPGE